MKLYAAYGSNLDLDQMARRCPKAVPIGKSLLRGHQLIFRNVADVIPWRGASVPIGIWQITAECEKELDIYEGVRKGGGLYRKEEITFDDGRTALIYKMNTKGIGEPSAFYFNGIMKGYHDFGLPTKKLRQALERTRQKAYPTASLVRRNMKREALEAQNNATV